MAKLIKQLKTGVIRRKTNESIPEKPALPYQRVAPSPKVQETSKVQEIVEDTTELYDEVDELKLGPSPRPAVMSPPAYISDMKHQLKLNKPIGHVKPTSVPSDTSPAVKDQKQFQELSYRELVERLKLCHMVSLAGICQREHLDGSFFNNISDVDLTKEFNMSAIDLVKFKKMRDENWVVNE